MAGIFKAYDVRGSTRAVERGAGAANRDGVRAPGHARGRPGRDPAPHRRGQPRHARHSVPLSAALCAGLTSAGLDVLDIGLATTPMNYFATGHLGTPAAFRSRPATTPPSTTASSSASPAPCRCRAITASRSSSGTPWARSRRRPPAPAGSTRGASRRSTPSTCSPFSTAPSRRGDAPKLRLAADAANGMGTIYRPLLEACGVELLPLYFELDGNFPNHEGESLLPETCAT